MKRLLYIDNLRIFLIALVVLHHLLITYGGPGGWYYQEYAAEGPEMLPYAMFVATNQSFFMAMFFMISAFFMTGSVKRKGPGKFLIDRLIRLGIPLLIFYFILNPLTIYILVKFRDGSEESLFYFLTHSSYFGFGPMWFVEALLLFTLIYTAYFSLTKAKGPDVINNKKLPGVSSTLLFALLLGFLTFIVRIWTPVGWALHPLNFQLPHFVQYIALFIVGVHAYQNHWFEKVTYQYGLRWFWFAQFMIIIVFPLLFISGGVAQNGAGDFMGGFTWQSLLYALWEQLTGLALMIGLTGIFRQKLNRQGSLAKNLSASAYTAYIIHTTILVLVTMLVADVELHPLVKFLILAPVVLSLVFITANLIRRLPILIKIL